ncbi:MFS general substrate transporter [Pholiota conissans]|uniref:MFS general substrate transporter n=1 Tax=Pholiota conissans TaxID=109636 RepID=A0A9P5ZA57_9AGAR|nr:MFS general substrate transporter [Pholiota conissans]
MSTPTSEMESNTARSSTILDEKLQTVDVKFQQVTTQEVDVEELLPVEFPEGGWKAWGTIAGAFLVQFTSFGYIASFGVYQDYYVREYLSNFSTSDIGWIGGVQVCLNFAPGIIAGRLFDRGYFYYLMTASILLYSIALFMLSISHQGSYYQVFLTNGVALGLACGLTYSSSLAIPGHYFKRKRAFAVGIVSSGSAVGAVIHPIMLNRLINGSIGFHNAVRISAAMNVSLLLVAVSLMRTRLPPKEKSSTFPVRTWLRQPAYLLLVLSALPCFLGLFYGPFYIQLNAVTHGVPKHLAFYSVSVLNAGSIFGRILPGALSHKFGSFNMATFFTIGAGIIILAMIAVHNFVGTVLFGVFFGLFSGACIALTPAMFAQMADHPNEIGTRLGIYFGLGGFIGLFANPILGALLTGQYHWAKPIIFSGVTMILTGITYGVSRHFVAKKLGTHKV